MANFLADASIVSQQVITAGLGPGAAASTYAASQIANIQPNQIANTGINAAFSLISGAPLKTVGANALQSLTGVGFSLGPTGGGLQGTKPVPLHTERAGSEASGNTPYSFTQDIEFFLLRADQSAPAASVQDQGAAEQGAIAATTQSGGNFLGDALKSPLGQLATGVAVNAALGAVQKAAGKNTLVAPLTGLAVSAGLRAATGTGIFSQPAANAAGGTASAVSNAVQTGSDVVQANENAPAAQALQSQYWAPSETYFTNTTAASFNGDGSFNPDVFTAPASSLGSSLGSNFPEITDDPSLADAINNEGLSATDWANAASLNLGLGSLTGGAPVLNEDATTIQDKDTLADIPKSWYFVTAPQDVSWSKDGKVATADTYGTNTPYVLYGSTSLRKLTLSNAMIEGFSDRKTVEANIIALETAMNMVIQKGYTAPYCWKVYSGGKNYGTFVISGVKVKEVMRDLRGFATRAFVDIELMQVPNYQVNSGRDLASKATLGGPSKQVQALINSQNKDAAAKAAGAAAGQAGANASQTGAAGAQDKAVASAKPSAATQQAINFFNTPLPSDIRLKERVVRVGTSPSGLGIYEWTYVSGGPRYRGVIAQEVAKQTPSAVVTMANGYLAVYYSMIDVDMEIVG